MNPGSQIVHAGGGSVGGGDGAGVAVGSDDEPGGAVGTPVKFPGRVGWNVGNGNCVAGAGSVVGDGVTPNGNWDTSPVAWKFTILPCSLRS